jgi:hypothetical protein
LLPENPETSYEKGKPKSHVRFRLAAYRSILFQPSVPQLEKLISLTGISELELWILDGTDAALVKRLKAKGVEILRKSNPRPDCECANAMVVEPELKRWTKPIGCGCEPPKRVLRLKHLVRKHGPWGTPFWGSDGVEEIEVSPPLED